MSLWLRYTLQRLNYAWQIGYRFGKERKSLLASRDELSREIEEGLIQRGMTEVVLLTGTAMCPALNAKAEKDRDAIDRLLVRRIPAPSPRNCHVGDVVAIESPYCFGEIPSVYIRRIAAMPGDQMLSESATFDPFNIPPGHCWILADDHRSSINEAIDSRRFGPVPLTHIRGRVIYNGYDKHDHGAVENSPEAKRPDEILLKYELDLHRLFACHKNYH